MSGAITKLLTMTKKHISNVFSVISDLKRGWFVTYRIRPKSSADIDTRSDEVLRSPLLAIVMQGPIVKEDDFTIETIKIYQKHFDNTVIILSTWKDEDRDTIARISKEHVEIVLNEKPSYSGNQNINFQIVSTQTGVKAAKRMGAEYVLKTRTDQRMYAPNVKEYLINLSNNFPVKENYPQKKRIVGVSLNTFKYRLYGLSDMLLFGHIDDLMSYWMCDLDERRFTAEEISQYNSSLYNFAKWRVCEVYLVTEFLQKLGRSVEWTLRDSWSVFADHFCVVDKESLDIYWPKYYKYKEDRWISYDGSLHSQEINFREWFNIYCYLDNKGVLPEEYITNRIDC